MVRAVQAHAQPCDAKWALHRYRNLWLLFTHAPLPLSLNTSKTCKFHCSDYEECRLLGFKVTVLTSQEAHKVSATEPAG
jgi:hypothetical protein